MSFSDVQVHFSDFAAIFSYISYKVTNSYTHFLNWLVLNLCIIYKNYAT